MNIHEKKYELIKFEDGDFSLDVNVSPEEETVWLTQKDMALLFNVSIDNISLHIKNIIKDGELDQSVFEESSITASDGKKYKTKMYNLDMIISVGYRVKSRRGIIFRNWANSILNNNRVIDDYSIQNMAKFSGKYELVKFKDGDFSLDVSVSPMEDTVWLTQEQIAELFQKSRSTITEHITNIFSTNELNENTSVGISDISGSHRPNKLYNLDVILAVGYRVNSKRGIAFRRWATDTLKQYLLNGYAINAERIMAYQSNILQLEANVINIENRLKNLEMTIYSDNTQIIFEGEILEPYTFLRKLFFLSRNEITIIDQYADKFLLTMLSDLKVKITIVTSTSSYLNKEIIPNNITILHNDIIHDRFIVIDDLVYAIGSSFNDIGKKRFFMMKLENITKDMILKERKKA